jgi:hypothetical protein
LVQNGGLSGHEKTRPPGGERAYSSVVGEFS